MKRYIVLLLVLALSKCFAYQQRILYYSEQDNVCIDPSIFSDEIHLDVFLERIEINLQIFGATACRTPSWRYADAVTPGYLVTYRRQQTNILIQFDQTVKAIYSFGFLHTLIANLTIKNPIVFASKSYECQLEGDGKQQHFGVNHSPLEPARITLKCEKLQTVEYLQQA